MKRKTKNDAELNKDKDTGALEKLARLIDPPGQEVSDKELIHPGTNIPGPKPDTKNAGKKPSDRK